MCSGNKSFNTKLRVKFKGSCLKQEKVTFTNNKVVNVYIACEINLWLNIQGADFALGNSVFGAVNPISSGVFGSCVLPGLGKINPCHKSSLANVLTIKLGQFVDRVK